MGGLPGLFRRVPVALFPAVALVLAVAAALAAGCTTARERQSPQNIVGSLRYRSAETESFFQHTFRSGNLYSEFRPVMIVDAIFQDERYRQLFLDTLQERYLVREQEMSGLLSEHRQRFDTGFEFLVLVYGGSNAPVRLGRADSNWKLFLRDDDGDLLRPSSVEGIRTDSTVHRYIDLYFSGLDRWSQLYRVRFPKLEKTLSGQSLGTQPFEMVVSGIEGTVTMRWEDAAMFYRTLQGIRTAAQRAAAGVPGAAGAVAPGGDNASPDSTTTGANN